MPTFAPPSTSSDNGSSQYERSFRTAGEITELEFITMANSGDDRMETEGVMNGRERSLMEQMNMMQQNYEQQMNLMKAEIMSIKAQTLQMPQKNTQPSTQGPPQVNVESEKKRKPLKWPEAYTHEDASKWPATYGVLSYIYERDVQKDGFLDPSDFFMQLFSCGVAGYAKDLITGQVEDMMKNQKTWDALGLLESMNEVFRDRNADKTASTLLHACVRGLNARCSR